MKRLYFIRHGLTEMNVAGLFAGRTETPLTAEGRKQARLSGREISRLAIDLIVSSPMGRALETAQIIAKEIGYPKEKISINRLLIERDFGSLEGQAWSPDLNMDGFSDIETDHTLLERAHLSLNWLKAHDEENILVVSHGAFGRALRAAIRKQDHLDKERLLNAQVQQWI